MFTIHYHHATKHDFLRFARSLGYLDWATQPNPFRRYDDARVIELTHKVVVPRVPYEFLYASGRSADALTLDSIGEFLRCSLGLSAWKQYGASRWALRVNPSSGNLHPTEGYVVTPRAVHHYAPKEHALEERCRLPSGGWSRFVDRPEDEAFLVALTSICWREAWKYGERAFRYCQHDCGHALGALRIAAALLGWRCTLLPRWSDAQVAILTGVSRDVDYGAAEREDPDCIAVVSRGTTSPYVAADPAGLVDAAQAAQWFGTANALSPRRIEWPIIDQVTRSTRYAGQSTPGCTLETTRIASTASATPNSTSHAFARNIIIRRRSALGFDGHSSLQAAAFVQMLQRVIPDGPPWDAIWWPAHVHLALFVHRVAGVRAGIYMFVREPSAMSELRTACRQEFVWEPIEGASGSGPQLFLLAPIDCRRLANRLSCDQDIAEDGFFSLAMVARFDEPLRTCGEWFYRNLFWECGLIGQVLYLEAEAAGARATGIGCYYDDPVHEVLGLSGTAWQVLYHFSVGMPVDDLRLTSEPGYAWEET
jgi:SagB-type dehydrogenase family enzyme